MSSNEQVLFEKLKALPLEQRAEVEDFVDFLAAKSRRRSALDRLLAIAPATGSRRHRTDERGRDRR